MEGHELWKKNYIILSYKRSSASVENMNIM